jgi:hypothetical protein
VAENGARVPPPDTTPASAPPAKANADLMIERIILRAGQMDPRVAHRLAGQVASALERAPLAGDLPQRAELVRLEVRPAPGATLDQLTQMIVAELMRELRRS